MTVASKICRRLSPRGFALTAIGLTILLCIYYTSYTSDVNQRGNHSQETRAAGGNEVDAGKFLHSFRDHIVDGTALKKDLEMCPRLGAAEADVSTADVFKDFEFQVSHP